MAPRHPHPSALQQARLLQFEAAYGHWCAVTERLIAAEVGLWDAVLHGDEPSAMDRLAAETLRLRREQSAAYAALLPLLMEDPP